MYKTLPWRLSSTVSEWRGLQRHLEVKLERWTRAREGVVSKAISKRLLVMLMDGMCEEQSKAQPPHLISNEDLFTVGTEYCVDVFLLKDSTSQRFDKLEIGRGG